MKFNKNVLYFWIIVIGLIVSINLLDNSKKRLSTEVFNINTNDKQYVYPLGHIIGVKADTDGVLVVGYEEEDVEYIGGIKKGDNIIKINNIKIKNHKEVKRILNELKSDEIEVTFERDNKYITENIKTKYVNEEYRLGLWVRDKISGIGTATFYDPKIEQFKAIGHAITDIDTGELLKIKKGNIYNAINIEIIKGNDNKYGKIKGSFDTSNPIGSFNNNSELGISGSLDSKKYQEEQLIEVASHKDIKLGPAKILFQDKNNNISSYDIKIDSIQEDKVNGKNMVVEVVDKDLIDYTGGIVQGMSGAPIIQNNKIIGAITHVFMDNPKKGYGIFIDEMIKLEISN